MKLLKKELSFKKYFGIISIIFFIILGAIVIGKNFMTSESVSIGIIGGADGPTAVFIANKAINQPTFFVIALVLFCVAIAFYKPIKRFVSKK